VPAMRPICLAILVGALPCFAAEEWADVESLLTRETISRLERGDVILFKKRTKDAKGRSLGRGRVVALVNRPFDQVWDHLCRIEDHPQFMPRLVDIEVYEVDGDTRGTKETVALPFKKVCYHIIQKTEKDTGTLTWRLDRTKKNDIRDTSGTWRLKPHGEGRCIVAYSAVVDSGMFLPKVLESFLMTYNLPDIVQALKKRAESDGTYTKRGWKRRQGARD